MINVDKDGNVLYFIKIAMFLHDTFGVKTIKSGLFDNRKDLGIYK
jgi:hypothetical protein